MAPIIFTRSQQASAGRLAQTPRGKAGPIVPCLTILLGIFVLFYIGSGLFVWVLARIFGEEYAHRCVREHLRDPVHNAISYVGKFITNIWAHQDARRSPNQNVPPLAQSASGSTIWLPSYRTAAADPPPAYPEPVLTQPPNTFVDLSNNVLSAISHLSVSVLAERMIDPISDPTDPVPQPALGASSSLGCQAETPMVAHHEGESPLPGVDQRSSFGHDPRTGVIAPPSLAYLRPGEGFYIPLEGSHEDWRSSGAQ